MTTGLSSWLRRVGIRLGRSSVVVVVYGTAAWRRLRVPSVGCTVACIRCHARTYARLDLLVRSVRQDLIAIFDILLRVDLRERLSLIILLESGKANFLALLSCLSIGFSLHSIEAHLFCVTLINTRCFLVGSTRSSRDAASSKAKEASCEEETQPSGEREPDRYAHASRSSFHGVNARLGDEEEGEVEDECNEGDRCAEARYACAEAYHGELSDMGEKPKNGRYCSERERDNM